MEKRGCKHLAYLSSRLHNALHKQAIFWGKSSPKLSIVTPVPKQIILVGEVGSRVTCTCQESLVWSVWGAAKDLVLLSSMHHLIRLATQWAAGRFLIKTSTLPLLFGSSFTTPKLPAECCKLTHVIFTGGQALISTILAQALYCRFLYRCFQTAGDQIRAQSRAACQGKEGQGEEKTRLYTV